MLRFEEKEVSITPSVDLATPRWADAFELLCPDDVRSVKIVKVTAVINSERKSTKIQPVHVLSPKSNQKADKNQQSHAWYCLWRCAINARVGPGCVPIDGKKWVMSHSCAWKQTEGLWRQCPDCPWSASSWKSARSPFPSDRKSNRYVSTTVLQSAPIWLKAWLHSASLVATSRRIH